MTIAEKQIASSDWGNIAQLIVLIATHEHLIQMNQDGLYNVFHFNDGSAIQVHRAMREVSIYR